MTKTCEKCAICLNEKEAELISKLIHEVSYHRYLMDDEMELKIKFTGEDWQRGEK